MITADQAGAAYDVLVEYAGANAHDREAFIFHVARSEQPCDEYRFCGRLGFGGKFRNNGNNDGIPYVDCYPEHETKETRAIVEEVNRRLHNLFAPQQ